MKTLIKPHGTATLQVPLAKTPRESDKVNNLPTLILNDPALSNVVMIGSGYFNPLEGFMSFGEAKSVCQTFRLPDGLFWPVPIINLVQSKPDFESGQKIALLDPTRDNKPCIALMDVSDIETLSDKDIDEMILRIFGTNDSSHPGVKKFRTLGNFLISGKLEIFDLSSFPRDYPETFRTAQQIREHIVNSGWDKVVAFQTRNPMHRAHEVLCKLAVDRIGADGLIIHMLLGKLKDGDIPAGVRDDCIKTMVDCYFSEIPVLVSGYGFDMLYAGPREALLHAIIRQNMGATHLIVGRDHAGVGSFYGAFEAQEIFDELQVSNDLSIKIFNADHTAYSKKLGRVVMLNEVDGHVPNDFVTLSGTHLRALLGKGEMPPKEIVRPEVAEILMNFYQS